MKTIERIAFVWNADFSLSGGVRALKELVDGHHSCTLCAIAYHRITQTAEWKTYKQELAKRLGAEIRQPCRNQLTAAELKFAAEDFPTVLAHTSVGIVKLLSATEINACNGEFAAFRAKLDERLQQFLDNQ